MLGFRNLGQVLGFLNSFLSYNLHIALPFLTYGQLVDLSNTMSLAIPPLETLYVNWRNISEVIEDRIQNVGVNHNNLLYQNITDNYEEFSVTYRQILESARSFEAVLRIRGGLTTQPLPLTLSESDHYPSVDAVLDELPLFIFDFLRFDVTEIFNHIVGLCML